MAAGHAPEHRIVEHWRDQMLLTTEQFVFRQELEVLKTNSLVLN
jgi:hypothetical protein